MFHALSPVPWGPLRASKAQKSTVSHSHQHWFNPGPHLLLDNHNSLLPTSGLLVPPESAWSALTSGRCCRLVNSPRDFPSWPPHLLSKAFCNETLRTSAVRLLTRMVEGLATPRLYVYVHTLALVCMHTHGYAQACAWSCGCE